MKRLDVSGRIDGEVSSSRARGWYSDSGNVCYSSPPSRFFFFFLPSCQRPAVLFFARRTVGGKRSRVFLTRTNHDGTVCESMNFYEFPRNSKECTECARMETELWYLLNETRIYIFFFFSFNRDRFHFCNGDYENKKSQNLLGSFHSMQRVKYLKQETCHDIW